jgi:two-component system sensor histidine kinase/response regulator
MGRNLILVVDDEPPLRELLAEVVETGDYDVHQAENGQQALDRVAQHTYDLIVCDLFMPTMDGPAFYREVQQNYPETATKIVFMTANRNLEEFATFLREVQAPVLYKPFTWSDLRTTLTRMIGPAAGRALIEPPPPDDDPFV